MLLHIPWYSIEGQARLAADVRVSRSTISRLINGRITPSYSLVMKVTDAVSRRLGKPIDARDLFTTDGSYPTSSACALCDCDGCLPPWAWDERRDRLRPEWQTARPGDWSRSPEREVEEKT
ncbi:MAG: helix-turn-helix transcriptional regulator [Armatimonadota bacterium]